MFPLILRTIKNNRTALLVYIVTCAIFAWMFAAIFPSMLKESEQLTAAFKNYPEAMMKALDVNIDEIFVSLEGFLAIEYYSLLWPIIAIILVIAYGSSAIAGEIDEGTIEVLLAQPLSRSKIYLAKFISGIIILLSFSFISNLSVIPFAILHNVEYQLPNLLSISVLGSFFAFAIFGACLMFSSFSSSRGKAASLTGGVIILMYVLNLFAKFQESIENIKYLSFFHYFDANATAIHNQINLTNVLVFLAVGIICSIIGVITFIKRDIAT